MSIDLHHGFGLPRPEDREKTERMSALRVSARFARLFRCQLDGKSDGEFRPGRLESWYVDICTVARFGRFVLLSEEESLFTLVISSGYRRSLVPVMERFHRRREELVRELGLSGIPPISFTTSRFGKRVNPHIIGSQNDFVHLLRADLKDVTPPLEMDRLQWIVDSLNESPMSYLGMNSPQLALLDIHDKTRNSPMARKLPMP